MKFKKSVLLTITTGRLLCEIGDVYRILNHMTRDNLFTHQLHRASEECKPWLLRWFPELSEVNEDSLAFLDSIEGDAKAAVEKWLATVGGFEDCEVVEIPADDHTRIDPFDELVMMRGTDEGIILITPEEGAV